MSVLSGFIGFDAQAQYALSGRVLGAGTVTSSSGGYSLVGDLGSGARNRLSAGEFQLRASAVPRVRASIEADVSIEMPRPDHWWKLDGDLLDAITGESAQAVNGASYLDGRVNQGFECRGTNYLDLGSIQGRFGLEDFTLSLWITADRRVVSPTLLSWREDCGFLPHWRLRLTAQNFSYSQPGFSYYGSNPGAGVNQMELAARPRGAELNVKDGRWHHVAVVRAGTNIVVYRDGQPILAGSTSRPADLPATGRLLAGIDPCSIGKPWSNDPRLYDNPLLGQIDEIKIFRRALTPALIAREWKLSRPLPVSPLSHSEVSLTYSGEAPGVFRWIIDAAPGRTILPEDLAGVQLEASPDMTHWNPLPNAARFMDGRIELADGEAFRRSGCFYRLVFR
ncbi:MAG: LamG domain-containing protein [Verrucomicrobiales bacterium]|nr:LamG domain-containing protein [Verrucomicrobiales bacterium]